MAKDTTPRSKQVRGVPVDHAPHPLQRALTYRPTKEEEEMFRVSPAMAVANRILSGFARPEEPEPSLADLFIANTFMEGQKLFGKNRKLVTEAMLRYRLDMKKAHRFMLDDTFTEMVTRLSSVPSQKTLARLQMATLPYDTTWIEFNLRVKVRVLRAMYKKNTSDLSDISPRMGMLLQRISDTDAVCTLVSEVDGMATPHLTCYFFSTTEKDFALESKIYFGCSPGVVYGDDNSSDTSLPQYEVDRDEMERRALSDSTGKASLWGYTYGHPSGMMGPGHDDMMTPRFLLRHGDVGFSRMYTAYVPLMQGENAQRFHDLVLAELNEFTGHIRWTVTLLAMLNEVPVHSELVTPSHQMKVGHFKKHQYVDYHKVSLRLPKKNPVPYFERKLREGPERRHRAHEVRAHWRTYLHEEHCKYDEHAWEYDHDEGYRLCGKCMAFGRLIHEHIRGNADLGWVRKDYVIKPST